MELNDTVIEQVESTAEQPERTFTQSEVNTLIEDRLKRAKSKYADYETLKAKAAKFDEAEEANKTELQRQTERADDLQAKYDALVKTNQIREIRTKISNETGVPATLLSGDDEETCKAQAVAILKFAKPNAYPEVPDAGETARLSGGSTAEQFANWWAERTK